MGGDELIRWQNRVTYLVSQQETVKTNSVALLD